MPEQLHHSPEQNHHTPEQHHHTPEAHKHTAEHANQHKDKIQDIRAQAVHEARRSQDVMPHEVADHKPTDAFVNGELKELAYARTLNRIRKGLRPASRTFSKVVHQPVVEAVSETTARTVGRPSGILGGGLLALAGTTAYYYITKHYGYDYSFFVFLGLLAIGFIAGWLMEFVFRAMHGSH